MNAKVKTETIWEVYSNTDLTEGRGREFVLGYAIDEVTAAIIGQGRYVMGTDCPVKKVDVEIVEYGAAKYILGGPVLSASPEARATYNKKNRGQSRKTAPIRTCQTDRFGKICFGS